MDDSIPKKGEEGPIHDPFLMHEIRIRYCSRIGVLRLWTKTLLFLSKVSPFRSSQLIDPRMYGTVKPTYMNIVLKMSLSEDAGQFVLPELTERRYYPRNTHSTTQDYTTQLLLLLYVIPHPQSLINYTTLSLLFLTTFIEKQRQGPGWVPSIFRGGSGLLIEGTEPV